MDSGLIDIPKQLAAEQTDVLDTGLRRRKWEMLKVVFNKK